MTILKIMSAIGISLLLVYGGGLEVNVAIGEEFPASPPPSSDIALAAKQCPTNLSSLKPKMEKNLQFIKSASFRKVMLDTLQSSIPQAIAQADGLAQQIAFLKQEIIRQERKRAHAEEVAREGLSDPSEPLKPCWHGKEGAYCHAMDQYLVSIAANLANQEFLNALQCYQREGVR